MPVAKRGIKPERGETMPDKDKYHKLPEGDAISVSLLPQGEVMKVEFKANFYIPWHAYETVRDAVMYKLLEIKKIIRDAEAKFDI